MKVTKELQETMERIRHLVDSYRLEENLCQIVLQEILSLERAERPAALRGFLALCCEQRAAETQPEQQICDVLDEDSCLDFAVLEKSDLLDKVHTWMEDNLPESQFDEKLWQLVEHHLKECRLDGSCALLALAEDALLPYYQLDLEASIRMENAEFQQRWAKLDLSLRQRVAMTRTLDLQRTQRASLLLSWMQGLSPEDQAVLLAHGLDSLDIPLRAAARHRRMPGMRWPRPPYLDSKWLDQQIRELNAKLRELDDDDEDDEADEPDES